MNECPLGEKQVVRIPPPVLLDRVDLRTLPGHRILQLRRRDRQPVYEERQVHGVIPVTSREVQLPGNGENVKVVLPESIVRKQQPRPEVAQVNLHPSVLDAVPQHVKDTTRVDLAGDPDYERLHCGGLIPAMQLNQLLEPLDLRLPNELPQLGRGEPKLGIVEPGAALPAPLKELELDGLLKGSLGMHARTHAAIRPVTASVMRACRRSASRVR